MDRPSTLTRTHPRAASVALLAAAMLIAGTLAAAPARGQDLSHLLPADTVLALGLRGLDDAAPRFAALVDPWVELGVGEALLEALGGVDALALLGMPLDAGDVAGEVTLPEELDGLDPWSLLGQEAWLGVSVTPFNPLPALTLLARVDGPTAARFDALFARERAAGALDLAEGALRFLQVDLDGFPVAVALDGDLLMASSNPDVLRGVLRQRQGSSEPAFGESAAAMATLGALPPGELIGFVDLGPLGRAVAPLAGGLGFDTSVQRLLSLLRTLGPVAGTTRVAADGTATTTLRRLDPSGSDGALRSLLGTTDRAPRDLMAWVPADALAVEVSSVDPRAWWGYLGGFVADLRELGVPDLNRTIRDLLGVDVGRDLFAWTAPGLIVVQTGMGELAPIGAPSDDLLGQSVVGLRTTDPAAAEAGLARLLSELGARVSLFADPFATPGSAAQVTVRTVDVGGVTVHVYEVLPGLTLSTAVAGGVAWIATSEDGLAQVLAAGRGGSSLSATFAELLAQVPAEATSFALSDDRASLAASGASIAQQVQLLAGFAGGGLDFDAVERATDALDAYLDAIAPRFGGTVSWTTIDAEGRVRSDERSAIDLR